MNHRFDSRGNLTPYTRSFVSMKEFEDIFVKQVESSITRNVIFTEYLRFITDLKELLCKGFVQWINGSFISNKINPVDIDFLTLLDFETFNTYQKTIEEKFTLWGARKHYKNLDAYTVKVFPEVHSEGFLTKSDLIYWENWFGRTKPNRSKLTFPKGYVEIHIL